jgi:NAD-dependent SIR2 family protein deacetylase
MDHRDELPSGNCLPRLLRSAAEIIAGAKALLITAGADMGVDSGLPDFRGSEGFWRAYPPYTIQVEVDEQTMRCRGELPRCPACGGLARPNILMFGDAEWDHLRSSAQEHGLVTWLQNIRPESLAVVEVGAGTKIPTVCYFSENTLFEFGGRSIRISLGESGVASRHIVLTMNALDALQQIDQFVR